VLFRSNDEMTGFVTESKDEKPKETQTASDFRSLSPKEKDHRIATLTDEEWMAYAREHWGDHFQVDDDAPGFLVDAADALKEAAESKADLRRAANADNEAWANFD
jgi:hypothetical protein